MFYGMMSKSVTEVSVSLTIKAGNIFEHRADVIIMACDGISRKTVAGLCRQMETRIGEEMWSELMDAFEWPIPYGSAQCKVLDDDDLFRAVILMSSLSHHSEHDGKHLQILSSAVARAFHLVVGQGFTTASMGLNTGGYRLTKEEALPAIQAAARREPKMELTIFVRDEPAVERAQALLRQGSHNGARLPNRPPEPTGTPRCPRA